MTTDASFADEDDAFAAEYVLGVLDAPQRLAAEARIKNDYAFAELVQMWTARFRGLNEEYVPVPAPNLLPQIERRLFPDVKKQRGWLSWLVPMGGATALASLALAAFLAFTPTEGSRVVVTLAADGSSTRFEASITEATIMVALVEGASTDANTVFELWAIEGDQAPRSLGVFTEDSITVPFDLPEGGVTLAVSLEPTGGSPTGLPTGPVVGAGTISFP